MRVARCPPTAIVAMAYSAKAYLRATTVSTQSFFHTFCRQYIAPAEKYRANAVVLEVFRRS